MGDGSKRTSREVGGSGVKQRGPPGACPTSETDAVQSADSGAILWGPGDSVTGSLPTRYCCLLGGSPGGCVI